MSYTDIILRELLNAFLAMQMLPHSKAKLKIQFNKYAQSAQCQSPHESSVSYAAAVVTAA